MKHFFEVNNKLKISYNINDNYNNWSRRKAMTKVKENLKTVIKPVDKRRAGAIKNTKDYLAETER